MKLGAVAYPVNTRLGRAEIAAELERAEPVLRVNGSPDLGLTEADLPLLGEHDLDALHCRILTSGTSGGPRPVGLTYGNHLWSAVGSAFNLGVEPTDRWLCCLPLFHVGGLSIVMRSVIYGTTAVVHDGFDVDRVAASLEGDGVTVISVVATQLDPAARGRGRPAAAARGPGRRRPGARGRARGGDRPRRDRGADLRADRGRLAGDDAVARPTRSASSARPAGRCSPPTCGSRTARSSSRGRPWRPGIADEDGWLHTGDLGRIDDEGFLYVEDRLGDVIVSGGENVLPAEVEEVLLRHPGVADAAAVGRADAEWQEAVTAVVVLRNGAEVSADELRAHCASELAGYKVPKRVEFVAELPRTASGKLLRRELR